ncbi:MAG: class F sortase [Patescibacteria group bacterium]|nr:class F sortase [Patescibacteria group bacterium]MDE1943963.1 class F sortase [Patescibacteria group bacterium]MDE1944942.1 class F sortase [Patescibacteria group bacterium]MDE2057542.1 class F sortase [Patescibacteria group bacterium]
MRLAQKRSFAVLATLLSPVAAGFIGMSASLLLYPYAQAAFEAPAADGSGTSSLAQPAPSAPTRLVIPAIGVDAAVQSVGLAKSGNGAMGVPSNFTDVAWYDQGPLPGAPGDAVIDGHLDGRAVPEAVFYRLGDLAPGDAVLVEEQAGHLERFVVTKVARYPYDADTSAIFAGDASGAHLNLITCAGDWLAGRHLYNERVVVFTTRAS